MPIWEATIIEDMCIIFSLPPTLNVSSFDLDNGILAFLGNKKKSFHKDCVPQ